ncbi:hypothetical protein N7457_001613 [Penicillium paradoxum]|uniref:uncharacterized protein n=1 Tax=Penicillium paradoxum TaxID=176176 RepID=UPI0025483103|nr:uncharacterized protein N7457_001613 [Penicillium paradoxum]KAJ5795014.1 hypothetical protein N7457_001613 [Penicillium paradoxum]
MYMLDLEVDEKLRSGIYEVKCPGFEEFVVVKFARFPWEIGYMEGETCAQRLIKDPGNGPRLLGHLTENGRAIGFILEHVTDVRYAELKDLVSVGKYSLVYMLWVSCMVV